MAYITIGDNVRLLLKKRRKVDISELDRYTIGEDISKELMASLMFLYYREFNKVKIDKEHKGYFFIDGGSTLVSIVNMNTKTNRVQIFYLNNAYDTDKLKAQLQKISTFKLT